MKKYDVVALGEVLIDFTQNGISAQGNVIYGKPRRCSLQCAFHAKPP